MGNSDYRTICFTGRRPKHLFGYDHDSYIPLVNALKDKIRKLHCYLGYTTFISGGAQGVDQLAFWAVNALKRDEKLPLVNVLYLPFQGQERIWRDTGLFSKQEYRLMISLADSVQYITPNVNLDNRSQVVKALYDRNHAMVNASDICIGVYPDSSWRTSKGGTAECLKYVQASQKSAGIISPTTLQVVDVIGLFPSI